ncbi:MAG: class I SAM-dependent methyltransferase [Colwellia sp.]|nr:class I SAM-dependent methyltransferase [Colwellia sp.]
MSNDFYNENANCFFNDTVNADLSAIYQQFLPLLISDSHILDAGCGSGRDTYFFIKQGFQVTAFDASEALVAKASEYTGVDVTLNTFENFHSQSLQPLFDAIWACASLLHVPSNKISASFTNLAKQLKGGGIFYCSFKYGNNDTSRNGRNFTNADEERLSIFIKNTGLVIDKTWITDDVRPDRHNEKWLNAILIKV